MKRLLSLLILSACVLTLGACGFALRGSDVLSANFASLQLNLQQPNSEFSRLLRRSLQVADVSTELIATVPDTSEIPVLVVGSEQIVSRPVSVNPRARAAQYEMRLSIDIALGQADQILIAPQTLFVERTYFEDIENISGNQEEVEIIAAEMRRELINQLMRRLEAAGG